MILDYKIKELADGFRYKFNLTNLLSLDDMIAIVKPPEGKVFAKSGFKFTNNFIESTLNPNSVTENGGKSIKGTCYLNTQIYLNKEYKDLMDKYSSRPNLTIRLHFNVISTDGKTISWGVNGAGGYTSWNPKTSDTSDFNLIGGLAVTSVNGLQFINQGNTIINTETSWVELIMGGGN